MNTVLPEKIDLLKLHKTEYVAPAKPVLIDVSSARYLSIAGKGKPGDARFSAQIGGLYAVAFTTKMTRKFARKGDYAICKLEARWPKVGMSPSAIWSWQLLIRTPEFIKEAELQQAIGKVLKKQPDSEAEAIELVSIEEGQCVQMLHVGPYDAEVGSFEKMIAFAKTKGLKPAGLHHEIYLSDPRRVPAERLRTILRLPVSPE